MLNGLKANVASVHKVRLVNFKVIDPSKGNVHLRVIVLLKGIVHHARNKTVHHVRSLSAKAQQAVRVKAHHNVRRWVAEVVQVEAVAVRVVHDQVNQAIKAGEAVGHNRDRGRDKAQLEGMHLLTRLRQPMARLLLKEPSLRRLQQPLQHQ